MKNTKEREANSESYSESDDSLELNKSNRFSFGISRCESQKNKQPDDQQNEINSENSTENIMCGRCEFYEKEMNSISVKLIYEENSFGVPVEFKNQQKYTPTQAKIFEFPVINSKKMKCLFREFKKFYNKELKISTLPKIQDANLFEEYAKINGLLSDVEEANFIEAPLSWLSISFHLSLIVNPSLCFSISTFENILKNYNYLSEEDPLLTVNDILFKPTNKKVRRFLMKKENRILIRNFIAHLSENYREEFTDEISIINNTCDLHD